MEILIESVNGISKTYLKGIMTEANFGHNESGTDFAFRGRNRNGRLYEFTILRKATIGLKENVDKGGVYCYRNHPNHAELIREDSCGKIVELDWIEETGRAHCKIEILEDTKDGKQVLKDLKEGNLYGISTRGTGSLDEDKKVKDNLAFITSDLIPQFDGSMQSCQSCSLSLTESIQSDYEDFLLGEQEFDCYLNLDLTEKALVKENLKQKIIDIFKG